MRIKVLLAAVVAVASLSLPAYEKISETLGKKSEQSHSADTHAEGGHQPQGHAGGEHAGGEHAGGQHHAQHKILVTSPVAKDVTLTQQYVCQIHSCRHIEIRALERGYLQTVGVREGQTVSEGDVMFNLLPTLYQAKRDADSAEAQLAQVEYDNTEKLVQQNIVSSQELKLAKAKLAKAEAQVQLAQAEVNFADIRAPFDGIVDRLHEQQGSLIEEGAMLTTLSDNSTMWVYFNVPEARYLEYIEATKGGQNQDNLDIELVLANHKKFSQAGKIGAIEADFNNETGNIAFRADFPNPDALLRHGQTGTILINRVSENAIVIPQRATYEILAKKYAYVVDEDGIVHQREIVIQNEQPDIYVIESGLGVNDKIVLEGIRQVRDGDKVDYEFRDPEEVLSNLKYHAE
ncbi:efflux RND transporter periplasmic adaptor subunit [Stieleria sp. TO1_6]|uniref:efflux RND transporter periplasmic adaptor subunit n=1 Tax=Stieleria tagensis TaxID=2956795 RepID=UPI00209B29BE|nr:efflux RND transporter periplasmic adaptor subunit [Stieleria tagensis]MCO8123467.1 efflux RND transporter periplasmic adaptor subunit [Stieleria tagensis]